MFWDDCRRDMQKQIGKGHLFNWRNFKSVRDTMYTTGLLNAQLSQLKSEQNRADLNLLRSLCIQNPNDFAPLVNQYYHMEQYYVHTGKKVQDAQSIVEFGGGFGALYHVLRNLGYNKKYTIIDLPEPIQIQKYYLDSVNCEQNNLTWIDATEAKYPLPRTSDLFIAMWSLSKVNENRPKIEDFNCNNYMIGYQKIWKMPDDSPINNEIFFDNFRKTKENTHRCWLTDTLDSSRYLFLNLYESRNIKETDKKAFCGFPYAKQKLRMLDYIETLVEESIRKTGTNRLLIINDVASRIKEEKVSFGIPSLLLSIFLPLVIRFVVDKILEKIFSEQK